MQSARTNTPQFANRRTVQRAGSRRVQRTARKASLRPPQNPFPIPAAPLRHALPKRGCPHVAHAQSERLESADAILSPWTPRRFYARKHSLGATGLLPPAEKRRAPSSATCWKSRQNRHCKEQPWQKGREKEPRAPDKRSRRHLMLLRPAKRPGGSCQQVCPTKGGRCA